MWHQVRIQIKKNESKGGKKSKKDRPPWMKKKPEDLTKSKEVEGKTYWWCEKHEIWAIHKPEDCKSKEEWTADIEKKKKQKAKLVEAAATLQEANTSNC